MENYKFFQNTTCEYFPCHKVEDSTTFNCLFCYCPLYLLKDACGGEFNYDHGVKDCSNCIKPHDLHSYEFVMAKMNIVMEKGKIGGQK